MYKLYIGENPEICFVDEDEAKKLSSEVKEFSDIESLHRFLDRNDNDIGGYLFYACWKSGTLFLTS